MNEVYYSTVFLLLQLFLEKFFAKKVVWNEFFAKRGLQFLPIFDIIAL